MVSGRYILIDFFDNETYCINSKYCDTITPHHICSKSLTSSFYMSEDDETVASRVNHDLLI